MDAQNNQYILKSDLRRLLGVDYVWTDRQVNVDKLKSLVRSKGKKRLIFIELNSLTKLRQEGD